MAKKLIDHEEAARMLGVSGDELNSMRDRKQVFPKRDAGVWKYELDQIQRLIEERKSGGDDSWDQVLEMDDLSQRVVHCVSAEALSERAARPRRVPRAAEKGEVEPAAKKRAV